MKIVEGKYGFGDYGVDKDELGKSTKNRRDKLNSLGVINRDEG